MCQVNMCVCVHMCILFPDMAISIDIAVCALQT